jgi:hypothetical protein
LAQGYKLYKFLYDTSYLLIKEGLIMNLKEMESRLSILEDIEEIKKLQLRYNNYLISGKRWDEIVDLFVEDGIVDLPVVQKNKLANKGKEAIAKVFKEYLSKGHKKGSFVVHPIISVDGNKAKGSWLLYQQFILGDKRTDGMELPDWTQGYYDVEYVREKGLWKIGILKYRECLTSPRALPAK